MSARALTVVMYHYVRPIADSAYPGIKGLELDAFREQIAYLKRHYIPVRMAEMIAALDGQQALPRNAALLTFDDGYSDHYRFVVPALLDAGLEGSFFVPADPVVHRRPLDVNKIHFILASAPDILAVVAEMERRIEAEEGSAESLSGLREKYWFATRFDPAAVTYVKRVLQTALPEEIRARIVAALFRQFVTADAEAFASELYLSAENVREMSSAGMHIGGHGDRHYWLGNLAADAQRKDIDASIAFLSSVGVPTDRFTFCYPYGSYDEHTLKILSGMGCAAAFTTRVELADIPGTPRLELPRLDTNDLPKEAGADENEWTRRTRLRK